MQLKFTKMHGAGNDFVMIDGVSQDVSLDAQTCRALADRHFGVGADQILVVDPPPSDDVDFGYRIFNADGGEVEQCGNGARCFVRFVRAKGLTQKRGIRVRTKCGVIEPVEQDDGRVRVDMGVPLFEPKDVAFDASALESRDVGHGQQWSVPVGQNNRWMAVASMGNPHAVQQVDDVEQAPVPVDGPLTEKHQRFANGVNAGFMQVVSRNEMHLRVWERGVGETLACGTGACAAGALAIKLDLMDSPVSIQTHGGPLTIEWKPGEPVYMTGDANIVFEGQIELQ